MIPVLNKHLILKENSINIYAVNKINVHLKVITNVNKEYNIIIIGVDQIIFLIIFDGVGIKQNRLCQPLAYILFA